MHWLYTNKHAPRFLEGNIELENPGEPSNIMCKCNANTPFHQILLARSRVSSEKSSMCRAHYNRSSRERLAGASEGVRGLVLYANYCVKTWTFVLVIYWTPPL